MATQVTVITGEGSTSYSVSTGARGPQGIQGPAGTGVTIDQTIIDGSTNAVAGNAVFDALALKAPLASPTFTGIVTAPRIAGRCDGLEVLCKAGLAINAGQVVYVTGASGNNIIIGLAQANAELTSSKTIGISQATLANNETGYVITEGLLTVSISAPAANEGDPIWLSPSTAGGMVFGVANKPVSPNHMVYLGVVTRKTGNTVVEIFIKIQNGSELDELADVAITSPVEGQALMRGATSWQNRNLASSDILGVTSQRLIGRHAGTSGAGEEVSLGTGIEFSGSTIQRSALTGDVTASAGSNATTLAATIAGNKTFSGQLELTGQAATNTTSAMTRSLSDTRYSRSFFLRTTTDVSSASTTYVNSAETILIPAGTYDYRGMIIGSTASTTAGVIANFHPSSTTSDTSSVLLKRFTGNASALTGGTFASSAFSARAPVVDQFQVCAVTFIDGGATNFSCLSEFSGIVNFEVDITITPRVAQRTTTDAVNAALLKAGSYIEFRQR
jgi:hypothetical protein